MLQRLNNAWSALTAKAIDRPVPVSPTAGLGIVSGITQTTGQLANMNAYGSVGWLFACVQRISQSVAATEWQLFRRQTNGDRLEIISHPLLDLWRNPSSFETREVFLEASQTHMELTGEMWWVVVANSAAPSGMELQLVRPDRIRPIPSVETFISGYEYRVGQFRIDLEPEDVVYTRMPHPTDPYRGLGPVQSLLTDLMSEKMAAQWIAAFFTNSAEPGGVIEYDGTLSDADFERAVTRWSAQHKGVANAHRVAILERGKWVDRKMTQRDMQFSDLRRLNRDTILGAFGMPLPILGITESVNRANAEAAEMTFARWVLRPRLERIRASVNKRLVPLFDASGLLEFDFLDPTPDDRIQAAAEAQTGYTSGILTLNEARARLGEGEVENGDEFKPAAPNPFDPPPAENQLAAGQGQRQTRAVPDNPLYPDTVLGQSLRIARNWERRLAAERDAIIEHLTPFTKLTGLVKLEASDLDGFDWDWWERYGDEVIAELERLMVLQFAEMDVGPLTSGTLQQVAAQHARYRAEQLLQVDGQVSLHRYTFSRIQELVAETIEEGQSLQSLRRILERDYLFSPKRAETIARTETAVSFGQGGKQLAVRRGQDRKHWLTQGFSDSRVDETCKENERQGWIPISEPFASGHDTIPAHDNCMCTVVYEDSRAVGSVTAEEGIDEANAEAIANSRTDRHYCPDCNCRLKVADVRGSVRVWCQRCKGLVSVEGPASEIVDKTVIRDAEGRMVGVREERRNG